MSAWFRLLWLVLAAALSGCGNRPRTPALEDGTAYQNDREGFSFLVPTGWSQMAKSDLPPGRVEKERLLVLYRNLKTNPPASLQVSVWDLPQNTDLAKLLVDEPASGITRRLAGPAESAAIGKKSAARYLLKGAREKGEFYREVVPIRKGERVYFFASTFGPGDQASRKQAQGTFARVVWTD